jgi:hypothetical protein
MSKRAKTILQKPLNKEHYRLHVEVYYNIGGPNYFSGGSNKRGYYLSVQPQRVDPAGWVSITAFSGTSMFLEEADRFSTKRLEEVARAQTTPRLSEQVETLCDHVLKKNSMELLEPLESTCQSVTTPSASSAQNPETESEFAA